MSARLSRWVNAGQPPAPHSRCATASRVSQVSRSLSTATGSARRFRRSRTRGDPHLPKAFILKRGMKGVYQHCGKKRLHRYAAEFAFRYSNRIANGVDDAERAGLALRSVSGKQLTLSAV